MGASACGSTATSPTTTTTTTDTFASRLQETGSASRSFNVTTAGTVKIQLVTVSQGDVVMGLGFGTMDGTTCVVSERVDTAPNSASESPQITKELAVGTYCVKLSDIGNLTQIVDFTITIIKPAS